MIHYEPYRSGQLFGIRYRFEFAGDTLHEHVHESFELHNIVVLKGTCAFESQGAVRILHAGDVFDFDGRLLHRVIACEPAEVIHFFLNGEPAQYAGLPSTEFHGSIVS